MANIVPDSKPNFNGYGTPFISIFDRNGKLILDKITVADGSDKPIAISDFSYTFNETEDDKGTISLWSNTPDFLNNLTLQHYGVLYLQWGYLNGDKRPALKVLIRNFKEQYNTDGFRLILEISDNYAPAKNSKSPLRAKLEEIQKYLSGVTDPDAAAKIEAFLNPHEQYRPNTINPADKWDDNYIKEHQGSVRDAEDESGLILPLNANAPDPITGKYLTAEDTPYQGLNNLDLTPKPKPGYIDQSTLDFYQGLGYPPGYVPPDYAADTIVNGPPITKPPMYAEGGNAASLIQDFVDKTTDEPTGVTGSDGNIKIFKRRKVSLFPPITEYIFRGGDGRLLEFNYDSDSSYDDDESVLRTIGINPETGALEQTEYANSLRKLEDAYTPTQYEQIKFESKSYEAYLDYILQGGTPNMDIKKPLDEVRSKPMLIQNSTEMMSNGGMLAARDQTAMVTTFHALPLSYREEAQEFIENEIKNLKAEDGFRIRANAKTLGDPSISNGVNILITGLSKARNGTYHITSCTHSISSGGYTNSHELYKVSEVPANIDTLKSGTSTVDIKTKIEKTNSKALPERLKAIHDSQGYILPSQIETSDYYTQMDKLDKDWVTKVGYTDYEITYIEKELGPQGQQKASGKIKTIVVRVPNAPRSGLTPPLNDVFDQQTLLKIIPNANIIKWDFQIIKQSKRKQ